MPTFDFEKLTLPVALAIAVVFLWRKLESKDAQVVQLLERFADVFEALAQALERRRESKRQTRESREQ